MNFSCVEAWPNQQNVLLVSKVHLMSKTLLVNTSPLIQNDSVLKRLSVGVLAALRSSSVAAPPSPERAQFSKAQAQPTQLICLLESFRHHHAVDWIPGKGYWPKLIRNKMLKCELSPESFSRNK